MRDHEIVAVVDSLGCLRCADCWDSEDRKPIGSGADGYPVPIYRDSNPHAFEACDCCGKVCNDKPEKV